MLFLGNHSFARKVTKMVLLTTSIALGTLTLAFVAFDTLSSRTMLQSRLATLADVVGQNSTAALTFDDPAAAIEVLDALHADPQVVSACLYNLSGSLFASYPRRAGSSQSCSAKLAQMPLAMNGYCITRPILRRGEPVGTLFLSSDLQDLHKRWKRLLLLATVLLLLALCVGGISGSLLQRRLLRPISDLAGAMRKVTAEQDFAIRVSAAGDDEIAQLGSGFNTMLSELEQRDIATKHAEAKLQYQALNDELTGLPNRRLLADRLAHTLALAEREGQMVALLYLDLDGFKLVNDTMGHPIGDVLLIQVAERLRLRLRKSDTLARIGGDEFTVLLANISSKREATLVARDLLEELGRPFFIEGNKFTIGASLGISLFPEDAANPVDLLQQADCAMYAAKQNGKNQVMYYTRELGSSTRERMNLENELRNAVERGEITVHYQPEFDLSSNRLVRFEALARWTHPTLGVISPAKFIPIAEESGIIVPLGTFILEQACAQAVTWQAMGPSPVQVAVNVSSIQFTRPDFVHVVANVLERTGLPPHLLQIELTESMMLSTEHPAEIMKLLREIGVGLAIDDFGTGYSCLSYLSKLPFNALKIDRAFVMDLDVSPESRALVHVLVSLAHNLGMQVIAEGVEKPIHLQLIRELGVNEAQGYLLGRPVPDPAAQLLSLFEDSLEKNREAPDVSIVEITSKWQDLCPEAKRA